MKQWIFYIAMCFLPVALQAQVIMQTSYAAMGKDGQAPGKLTVTADIAPGYFVYADNDTANGLTALSVAAEGLRFSEEGAVASKRYDKLFNKAYRVYSGHVAFTAALKGEVPAAVTITLKSFAATDTSFIPIELTKEMVLDSAKANAAVIQLPNVNLQHPLSDCGQHQANTKSLWAVFLLGLAGGFIALLTPCVFPMIPLTVSYFTKHQKPVNGLLYGGFIFLIYVLASVPFHIVGTTNPQIFNAISTNVWVNLAFFVIFVLFALSFFGLFEITLPASLGNVGNKGGIFFMALTLVVVSFSCTGPLLGTLLAGVASNGAWALTAGAAGFGLALGLPFGLFAVFPHWLQKLPKSGGWLGTVKKILAFIELAFAFKFLSNADLIGQWGLLKREVFVAVWIIILLALAVFLLLTHKTGLQVASIFVLLFGAYVAMDYAGIDLPLLSGFPPPRSYSFSKGAEKVKPAVMNDFQAAVVLAKQQHKPVMIDFTGWACVNCRKMEEHVWTKPSVAATINKNYVLVSLYVDDKKDGPRWADFEAKHFGQLSQPLYVLLSPDGRLLNHPVGYTADEKDYSDWLQCGLDAFKNN